MAIYGVQELETGEILTVVSRPFTTTGAPGFEVQERDETGAFAGVPFTGSKQGCDEYVTRRTIAAFYKRSHFENDMKAIKRLVQSNARGYKTSYTQSIKFEAYGAANRHLRALRLKPERRPEGMTSATSLLDLMRILDFNRVSYKPGRIATYVLADAA